MPSSVIHLQVAERLIDRLGVIDKAQFVLGCIAPDSVNIDGFAPMRTRYTAHSRSLDPDEWKDNVKKIYMEYRQKDGREKSFGLGVCVHLLTDIFWDEFVQPVMFRKIPEEDKWEELYRYNAQVSGEKWYADMKALLAEAVPCDYGIISAGMMGRYRDSLINDSSDMKPGESPEVVKREMVFDTADRVGRFIRQIQIK